MKADRLKKEALIRELTHQTYVMLRPSPLAGVGVFAVRHIPHGCREMFGPPDAADEWITLSREEVDSLPPHARRLVENYCLYDTHHYFVPQAGFKKMDVSLFLNHSDTPNIVSIDDGEYFETLRAINEGEELLIDYGSIVAG
ncbi:MAG: SET domain-containing protein [Cyclobacteriaceae bacterium]|nr:SET domain-containing protein [Cyclobacteriaceae bacterium]